MKQFKYALSLAVLFFIVAIIPGLICVICGFDAVFASSGIALAAVFLLKGKIAKKIFGSNNHHSSSPGIAIILIIISIISGVFKYMTFTANRTVMERLGYSNEMSREDLFTQLMLPLIVASLFWAVVVGIVAYFRGRGKKSQLQDVTHTTEDNAIECMSLGDIPSEKLENNPDSDSLDSVAVKDDVEASDDAIMIQDQEQKNTFDDAAKRKIRLKCPTVSKKGVLFACCSFILIILCVFIYTHRHPNKYQIGEYLYVDGYNNIHSDLNCDLCLDVSPRRILYKDFDPTESNAYCRKCIPDYIYKQMLEDCESNIRISQAYSAFCQQFSTSVYSFMFESKGECANYIKDGNLWDLHRLYVVNVVRDNDKNFESFKDFLVYFDREDLIENIPNIYIDIKKEEKELYLKLYNRFTDYNTGYQYNSETDDEFSSNAQQFPKRRMWVYEVCKGHMNIGTYEDFERTILF